MKILHLEDNPNDAVLVRANLASEGIECELVEVVTEDAYQRALERGGIDLILSDFDLPSFDGVAALRLALRLAPSVPFIFVSGAMGEDAAILALRSGARDYVLKQRLSRLGPAVRRAAAEAEELVRRKEAERALRESEERLRQSQKMEAIGRLAGGVAHDFNNLLTVILGHCQLLRTGDGPAEAVPPNVDEIEEAANRACQLTRQLLAFSRQQVLELRVLDLNALILETHGILKRLIGADIELFSSPGPHLGHIRADAAQVNQILMNLVVNARDAMPRGGKLTIETAKVELDKSYAHGPAGIQAGPCVMLAVSDTGCGMNAETLPLIFEPFFTTKEIGQGTGLGLSTVHGIVTQSGGHIEVLSEPGRGATFKIYFPSVDEALESPEAAKPRGAPARGSETVLLVEDEPQVRAVVSAALRRQGYVVIEAGDGQEALGLATRDALHLDLLLTDLVLPRLGGEALAVQVQAAQPWARVLFISGYTTNAVFHQGVLDLGSSFLQKPFTPTALCAKVREVLDEGRDAAA